MDWYRRRKEKWQLSLECRSRLCLLRVRISCRAGVIDWREGDRRVGVGCVGSETYLVTTVCLLVLSTSLPPFMSQSSKGESVSALLVMCVGGRSGSRGCAGNDERGPLWHPNRSGRITLYPIHVAEPHSIRLSAGLKPLCQF